MKVSRMSTLPEKIYVFTCLNHKNMIEVIEEVVQSYHVKQ